MDFDAFYAANYERIRRAMILAFKDSPFAEETTQEAFYRALRRWAKVSRLDHPEAWTMVVALNRGRDVLRRRRRHDSTAHILVTAATKGSDEAMVDDRMAIMDLLASVSDRQREALVLRYIGELTIPEIAKVMGCAEGTVKSTLHAAIGNAADAEKGPASVSD
jgi:RNA polymerase sigma-70 factor (ECF subfamily)